MSWLFSQALVEAFSQATCSDGEPSAQLSVMPTPHQFWRNDKPMDVSRLSQFGLTCAVLTADRGEALLMWFREGFLVKTLVQPEKGLVSKAQNQGCGVKWHALSVRYDLDTHSWKTAHCLWEEDLPWSSVTLPRWGMTRSGALFQHPTLERPISATVSGLWQTPVADDAVDRASGKWNSRGEPKLSAQVKLWPTPKANDAQKRGNFDGTNPRNGLAGAVRLWPTPCARDYRTGDNQESRRARMKQSGEWHSPNLNDVAAPGGQLNPNWEEWLMNWPVGWTSLESLKNENWEHWKESSTAYFQSNGMREMWFDQDPSEAPQGQESSKQLAGECGDSLSILPQRGSHAGWNLGKGESGTCHLQSVWTGISTQEDTQVIDMQQKMPIGMGSDQCRKALEFVPRIAIGIANRVERVKAIGNGQVPIVAATAWRILTGELKWE